MSRLLLRFWPGFCCQVGTKLQCTVLLGQNIQHTFYLDFICNMHVSMQVCKYVNCMSVCVCLYV